MSDQQEVWTAVAQLLRAQLTESVWYSTFSEVVPQIDDEHADLVIQVPSTLARERILTRYQPLITDAMDEIGVGDRRFDVIIGGADLPEEPADLLPTALDLTPDASFVFAPRRPPDASRRLEQRHRSSAVRTRSPRPAV